VQIGLASGAVAAEIAVTVTNTGTFSLVVDDVVGTTATGTYRLTLAQAPGEIFVAPGDEGGPMTNGAAYQATMPPGDLDVWSFAATTGDSVVSRSAKSQKRITSLPGSDSMARMAHWLRRVGTPHLWR